MVALCECCWDAATSSSFSILFIFSPFCKVAACQATCFSGGAFDVGQELREDTICMPVCRYDYMYVHLIPQNPGQVLMFVFWQRAFIFTTERGHFSYSPFTLV